MRRQRSKMDQEERGQEEAGASVLVLGTGDDGMEWDDGGCQRGGPCNWELRKKGSGQQCG